MNNLTHLSLFSGIGGLDLAAEWAGFKSVGQCEWADYPTKILEKHWPNVPRWRDIHTLTKESFYERTGLRTVDLISGGFPCQPFSVAGQRRGAEDDRYLWPEMLRVIQELRPTWVVGENVAGIVNMALDTVLSDLEGLGYACQALIIPACAVDAPHRRDRCAILGYSMRDRSTTGLADTQRREKGQAAEFDNCGETLADTYSRTMRDDCLDQRPSAGKINSSEYTSIFGRTKEIVCNANGGDMPRLHRWGQPQRPEKRCWRAAQPGLGGVVDGISYWLDEPAGVPRVATGIKKRVDRLKCLGNAVVPQQFYPIFKAIADIERSKTDV